MKTVRTLLEQGANPDVQGRPDTLLNTPLAAAINTNRKDVAVLLLERGANINRQRMWKGRQWHAALHTTIYLRYLFAMAWDREGETLQLLFDRGARAQVPELSALLLIAAREAIAPHVKILLRQGADPNMQAHNGATALHRVVLHKYKASAPESEVEQCTFGLIAYGADVNAIGGMFGTALIAGSQGACRYRADTFAPRS